MVSTKCTRKYRLRKAMEFGIPNFVYEDIIEAEGRKDFGVYRAICGLWFEGYKVCPYQSLEPCGFIHDGYGGPIKISTHQNTKCPYSTQKLRAHLLTRKKVEKLIGFYGFNSEW